MHIALGDRALRVAVARLDATSDVRPGQTARLWINTSRLHLFDPHSGASLTRDPEAEPVAAAGTPA